MNYSTKVLSFININGDQISANLYHLILSDFSSVENLIEKEIKDIWNPNLPYDLSLVKKDIFNLLRNKSEKQKRAICAEFFMHLFLRFLGYSQECLFSNLEERSMKKGFDGLYSQENMFWLAESKSAISDAKHKDKVVEAINDLENKVCNTSGNNPWENAINHFLLRNHNINSSKESILKKIESLSTDFSNNISHKLSEFNIIPVSTLFVDNNQTDEEIKNEIQKSITGMGINNLEVLCIDNDIYDSFIIFLGKDNG